MKIKSICIVGGGSAGWMTAAAFSKLLKTIKVTLVESPEVPKIGVGESTIPEIHEFLDAINVDDKDWMKKCDASYKLGINFIDFYDKGTQILYPFFREFQRGNGNSLREPDDWFSFKLLEKDFKYSYTDYVAPEVSLMCKKHKLSTDSSSRFCVNRDFDLRGYAYQVDAIKFAKYLKDEVALTNGVDHVVGHVIDYNIIDGKLNSIKTKEGGVIEADLFIDCTGFKSEILGKVFKTKYIPFEHILNDSALFTPIKYTESSKEKELEVVTDCIALNNGWVWNTPLWSRVGTGYVYSSKHVDKNNAEVEFRNHLSQRYGNERVKDLEFKSLQIRNGKHERCWVSNVVAIGLSYGFIEPLESTGLFLVHEAILRLANVLLKRDGYVGSAEVCVFNKDWDDKMNYFLWFVSMHFFLSKRDDTQYWRDCVDKIDLESSPILEYFSAVNRFYHSSGEHGYNFIGYNMDMIPVSYVKPQIKDRTGLVDRRERFIKTFKKIEDEVDQLSSHYQILNKTIYK